MVLTTDGTTWKDIGDRLPPALPGEAAFAASGTCAATQGGQRAWLATGAAARARILATIDGGGTWAAYDLPIVQGTPTSGAFSVDFRDAFHGIVGGGELAAPDATSLDNVARSSDGGQTWQLAASPTFPGAIYGLTYVRGREKNGGGHGARGRGVVTRRGRHVVRACPGSPATGPWRSRVRRRAGSSGRTDGS